MKKFFLIIEDDFELMGNGLGNVASHQYIPSLFLMKISKNLGLKPTFMVDVAQQLVYAKHQESDYNIKVQKELWDYNVRLLKKNGFDVQLHLHVQWLNAKYKDGFFFLDKNWSIAQCDQKERKQLLKDAITYLHDLLRPLDSSYKINSFKAGSWALQPSVKLFQDFTEAGIKLVMGVRRNMNIEGLGVNYENLEEDTLPYYPDHLDLTKIGKKGDIIMLPLSYIYPSYPDLMDLGRTLYLDKKNNFSSDFKNTVPKEILYNSPIKEKIRFRLKLNPYITHLKIGGPRSFKYLKNTFEKTINRLRKYPGNGIPIVIESHTKNFINNYRGIEKFLEYIVKHYSDEFESVTVTDYINEINKSNISVTETK